MSDGVALTSARHPPSEELIEKVCRAICLADGVGPDLESVGLGAAMPKGKPYKMWEARRKQAIAAIYATWDHELPESELPESELPEIELDPDSIVTAEIDIHR